MYDQIREDTLYIMFYAVVTAMAMMASCYLLLRRGVKIFITFSRRLAFIKKKNCIFAA